MFKNNKLFPDQIIPLGLTVVVFAVLTVMLYGEITFLNNFILSREKISLELRAQDILVGLTIYLKTSIDFAILIGRLMAKHPGWKNRVMIEIGTAAGNALGTLIILLIWDLFREVPILMAIMIIIASLVLFKMAEDGLEHVKDEEGNYYVSFGGIEHFLEKFLERFNKVFAPLLNKIMPDLSFKETTTKGYKQLFIVAFTIPFILGLDDFAGYIPLFNIVNVFGFAIGVLLGHMILNLLLFLSPSRTISAVKNPVISFLGSIAFIGLGIWGLIEAVKLLVLH